MFKVWFVGLVGDNISAKYWGREGVGEV